MAQITSKGRKMEMVMNRIATEEIVKKFRGNKVNATKNTYDVKIITDYGVEIHTTCIACYPSETYTLPDGNTTSNKWDLYEWYKKEN